VNEKASVFERLNTPDFSSTGWVRNLHRQKLRNWPLLGGEPRRKAV
jgi:hypothetical protein